MRVGTDEHPARPRMTGTVIRTFGGAESFKVESLFGTDERLARPRMTGTVNRTFWRPSIGPLLRLFNKAGTNGIHHDIVPFLIQRFRSPNSMIKEATIQADMQASCKVPFPRSDHMGEFVSFRNLNQRVQMIRH